MGRLLHLVAAQGSWFGGATSICITEVKFSSSLTLLSIIHSWQKSKSMHLVDVGKRGWHLQLDTPPLLKVLSPKSSWFSPGKTEQAFINNFQCKSGLLCCHQLLHRPGTLFGLCPLCASPTNFTPVSKDLLGRSVLLDGKIKP